MSNTTKNRLSIYLIKEEYVEHKDILQDFDNLKSYEILDVGVFYYRKSYTSKPKWLDSFFGEPLSNETELLNSTSKGVLLVAVDVDSDHERIFAVPFGYGWKLINPGSYEERFGLKTALNIVNPDSLRKIDKKNLSATPKDTSEQLSRVGKVANFVIDIEQDLIRSITGKVNEAYSNLFGETVYGKDALSVSTEITTSNVVNFLIECYKQYGSKTYKEHFGWIDQIADVKDPNIIDKLHDKLICNFRNVIHNTHDKDHIKLWMAIPEIIEWSDVRGFQYNKKSGEFDDIRLRDFIDSIPERVKSNLSVKYLKDKNIECCAASSDQLMHVWKAYNCLYCEIREENDVYLLSNGKWYKIVSDFVEQVHKEYRQICDSETLVDLPECSYKNEEEYNEGIAELDTYYSCMDKKMIRHGGGHSSVEFCDLFTNDGKIIHVKRYGKSAVLSHLFSQGIVSGELFISDMEFREKVNKKLPDAHKFANAAEKPNASEYQVIFAVISSSKGDLDIPFFSKITARNAIRRLESFGYKVALQKIEVKISECRSKA